jgi:transcriptional regulator with XRE-family HTH domain
MEKSESCVSERDIRLLFAKNLKHLREQQHLSQMDLSGLSGITFNFINSIENCKKWVSPKTIAILASALKVKPHQFFIDEKLWNANERDIYLDNISDSFLKWVGEQRAQYPEDNEEL